MLNFKIFLRGKGLGKRSVHNNFLNVMIFLQWAKVEHAVQKGDWPPKPDFLRGSEITSVVTSMP